MWIWCPSRGLDVTFMPVERGMSSLHHGAAYAVQQAERAILGCREGICTSLL